MKTQGPELFVKYATRVWGCQNDFEHPEVTAREGIQRFRDFMTEIGMPATISELGGKEEDIPVMVENMFYGAAWTAFYCASAGFRFAGSSPRFAAPVRASRPSPGGPPEGAGASLRFRKKDSAKSQNNFAQTSHGRRHRRPPRFAPVSPFCKK